MFGAEKYNDEVAGMYHAVLLLKHGANSERDLRQSSGLKQRKHHRKLGDADITRNAGTSVR